MGIQALNRIVLEYLVETGKKVRAMGKAKMGKKVLGEVPGRPEDLEIEIDRVGEDILKNLLAKYKVNAAIFSECKVVPAASQKPDVYAAIDPFDNTILFFSGFRHAWYTALTFFDKERQPLCGGIGDILDGKAWIFDGKKTFLLDVASKTKTNAVPHAHRSLEEPIVLASYLMSSQYSVKFLRFFGDAIKRMHPKALLYPFGGSHIYGYLADGRVDAYIMFDEPRTEISPGFAIAKSVGCEIGEIDRKGNWHDYEFIPSKHQGKVGFFVAACCKAMRDSISSYYKKTKKQ
ncbi:MAG: hypothetical protein HYS52_01640 [Candidatus Wildermuthbacteria bacterium]|nr:hypothetical protein [Candidatus Wildermuthbacteria bacterium]